MIRIMICANVEQRVCDTNLFVMIGTPGPFPVIESDGLGDVEKPISAPRRRYSCAKYDTCLNLACALNWDNFTCRGCSGEVNQSLLWQAHQARRKDKVARRLCNNIPTLSVLSQGGLVQLCPAEESNVRAIAGFNSDK